MRLKFATNKGDDAQPNTSSQVTSLRTATQSTLQLAAMSNRLGVARSELTQIQSSYTTETRWYIAACKATPRRYCLCDDGDARLDIPSSLAMTWLGSGSEGSKRN